MEEKKDDLGVCFDDLERDRQEKRMLVSVDVVEGKGLKLCAEEQQ